MEATDTQSRTTKGTGDREKYFFVCRAFICLHLIFVKKCERGRNLFYNKTKKREFVSTPNSVKLVVGWERDFILT